MDGKFITDGFYGFADGAGVGPGDSVGVTDGVVGAGDAVGFPKVGLGVGDREIVGVLDGEGLGSGEFSSVGASVAFDGFHVTEAIIDGIGVGTGDPVGPIDGARETDGTPDVRVVGTGAGANSVGLE